jgi:hypothetical protein
MYINQCRTNKINAMKKLRRTAMLAVVMMFIVSLAYSENDPQTSVQKNGKNATVATPGKFVDNNKDGVCDNHQAKMASGKCTAYVDKDGDGKCDNCKGTGTCKGTGNCKGSSNCCGAGAQKGQGQGKGNCGGGGCGKQYRNGCGHGNTPASGNTGTDVKK